MPFPLFPPRYRYRYLFRALCLSLALTLLVACDSAREAQPRPAPDDVIRIYSSLPTKGTASVQGAAIRRGIELAITQRNHRAGRWQVEYLALEASATESGDWTPESERDNARLAAADPSAIAYIGPYTSGATSASLPITNRANLLQLGVSATWPGLTLEGWNEGEPGVHFPTGKRNYARLMAPDSAQGELAAGWAESVGARSILVLTDGSSYSEGLAASFADRARARGRKVVGPTRIEPLGSANFASILGGAQADAIFYAPSSVGEAVAFGRKLPAGPDPAEEVRLLLSDTALSDKLLNQQGIDRSGWRIVYNGLPLDPLDAETRLFSGLFEEKNGVAPSLQAANAYDAANLVLDAAASWGRDRAQIRDTVLATQEFRGASGVISFDRYGDRMHYAMSGYRVEQDRFVFDRILTVSR